MTERMRRVNEAVREVLSEALGELRDPGSGFMTVTGVDTSPDLRHATVYVSVLGSSKKRAASLEGLQSSAGVLQARATGAPDEADPAAGPEYDPTIERWDQLGQLIDELSPE